MMKQKKGKVKIDDVRNDKNEKEGERKATLLLVIG